MHAPAVIAIPVFKLRPSELEALSLSRCAEVLGRHPLVFFGPRALDFGAYRAAVPSAAIVIFDDRYFRSVRGYSELLVTTEFYKAFAAGTYDSVLQGMVKAWANSGFTSQIWRPGWEMNVSSMPSYAGNDAATQAEIGRAHV